MKNLKSIYFKLSLLILSIWLIPGKLLAQASDSTYGSIIGNLGKSGEAPFGADPGGAVQVSLGARIGNIIELALSFTGVITFAIFLIGGFMWLTARGDEDQVKTAKAYIRNGVIGTAIVVFAYSLTFFITNYLYGNK